MDGPEGVVGEERVRSTGEAEVVFDVGGALHQVHALDVVAQGDPLVEGGVMENFT